MTEGFHAEEEKTLRECMKRGDSLHCPLCESPLQITPIRPSPQVAYVRDRVALECSACGRRTVLDRKRS
jgi:hypothetical protein